MTPDAAPADLYAVTVRDLPEGWLVAASSGAEAVAIVRGTVPRAAEVERAACHAWPAVWFRGGCLAGWPRL